MWTTVDRAELMEMGENVAIRVGVLGCAEIAWRRMVPALDSHPDTELVAVASRDPAKARRFTDRFGAEPVHGYDSLLDRSDIDAVYLPLPPALIGEWVARALAAGKHVLAEKPMLAPVPRLAALVERARTDGLALFENYMFLQHAQHQAVRELVADGRIGPVRSLTAEFSFPGKESADIRHRAELGGGALNAVGVYPLRTASLFLGSGLEVAGARLKTDPRTGVDLGGAVLVVSQGGVPAQLSFGMEHAYRSRYEIAGSDGRIIVPWAYTPPPDHAPVLRIERNGTTEELTVPPDDQFRNVLNAFVARIRLGTSCALEGEALLTQARLLAEVRAAAPV
jgi:NDP-hexose-3-ketoreductase